MWLKTRVQLSLVSFSVVFIYFFNIGQVDPLMIMWGTGCFMLLVTRILLLDILITVISW